MKALNEEVESETWNRNPQDCGGQVLVLPTRRRTLRSVPELDSTEYLSRIISKFCGFFLKSSGEDIGVLGRKNAKCEQGVVEGCEDYRSKKQETNKQ